jgi:estrogen-related receptor ERR
MQMEYCESQDSRRYEVSQSRSPGSPDRQYCSSTTQPLGDSMLGHAEVSLKVWIISEWLVTFQWGDWE